MTHRDESSTLSRREAERDVMQATTHGLDRAVIQIRMALYEGDPNVRHLLEQLRDGDPELTRILARLRDEGDAMRTTLSALVQVLEEKPLLVDCLRRLARPREVFRELLEMEPEDR